MNEGSYSPEFKAAIWETMCPEARLVEEKRAKLAKYLAPPLLPTHLALDRQAAEKRLSQALEEADRNAQLDKDLPKQQGQPNSFLRCEICERNLNGPSQMEDHIIGKTPEESEASTSGGPREVHG